VENVAWPEDIVPVPSIVLESLNCTVPVAVLGDMVAVNVIELPMVDGFCDDASVVVVVPAVIGFTICVSVPVLGTSFASPRYFAMILCDPRDNDCVENVAWPDEIVPVPSIVLESLNCTVPVAVLGDMVVVNVTEWLMMDGFWDDASVVVVMVIGVTVCVNEVLVLETSSASPRYFAIMV